MVEIIAINAKDCEIIEKSKANRIELCEQMEFGGFTPSIHNIEECLTKTTKPIRVMIRNSEHYSTSEHDIDLMINQIKKICKLDIEGIVIGCNNSNTINTMHLKRIVEAANGKKIVYHRAFDELKNNLEEIEVLLANGVHAILTNGTTNCISSEKSLENLESYKSTNIEVVAGGGVNLHNAKTVALHSNAIHIGTACRYNYSYDCDLDIEVINSFCELANN